MKRLLGSPAHMLLVITTGARAFWPAASNFNPEHEIRTMPVLSLDFAAGQKACAPGLVVLSRYARLALMTELSFAIYPPFILNL